MNYAKEAERAVKDALAAESEYYRNTIGGDDVPAPYNHIVAQLAILSGWLKVQSLSWLADMQDEGRLPRDDIDDLEDSADEAIKMIKENRRS